ncbi:site-specific integrase [Frankia sp. CiP3]|uniref:tyrosine-type recombinase/integrase n=1 Tax=Frankia sp. CiP3 TaxID=2880971 RepID=UPI001EF6E2A6|nr:site-specific integrase [Frankia sp. CiP3]
MTEHVTRDVEMIRLPRWGRVVPATGVLPWLLVDDTGKEVEPVRRFLLDFLARGNRPGSVRSYAYDLLRWWRWLQVVDVEWDKATSAEVRDFVLWLQQAEKLRNSARTRSAATAGTVNPVTRKRYLGDSYEARTIRHSNAVLRSFYEFWIELGAGPLVNPVSVERGKSGRPNQHRSPLEPLRSTGRARYNPKLPKRRPREIPDGQWKELFGALRSNRDRGILALAVSNAVRASELLGLRGVDLDWGDQTVRVTRKGTGAEQWLPASPEAFVWIRLYLAEIGELDPGEPIWWTLRRRDLGDGMRRQPMTYETLRAVFRRVNAVLGTNYSTHDLRHTCALRMARDENLSLRDVQVILGHAHLSTTADVYLAEDEKTVVRRVGQYLAAREHRRAEGPRPVAGGYDTADLSVLLGGVTQ